MKIIVVGNYTRGLLLFRLPLIKAFVDLGHSVIAYAPEDDSETRDAIKKVGAEFRRLSLDRTGTNVFRDLLFLFRCWWVMLWEKPDIMVAYTIKPVLLGTLAARLAGVKSIYSIITGLGYVFIGDSANKRLLRLIVGKMYKWSLARNQVVFFLNSDDLNTFERMGFFMPDHKGITIHGEGIDLKNFSAAASDRKCITLTGGSGVDTSHYIDVSKSALSNVVFLLIARLIRDKGITEYVEAARLVKSRHPQVEFWIIGPTDSNPAAYTQDEVQRWVDEGIVSYHGEIRDVRPYLRQCSVFVLPSYREGLPRTVLEAMAVGRPIITTDVPGCRDTVTEGVNGFLVPVKSVPRLVDAMERFIEHPELIEVMGRRSREIAEEKYDVQKVNKVILQAMELI